MPSTKLLKVYGNPFAHVDAEGRPSGHLQYEPNPRGDAHLRWIGCRVVATKVRDADRANQVKERHDHTWEFETDPVTVPARPYYLRALQHRDLIAADPETFEAAFGTKEGFVDAKVVLAQLAEERQAIPHLHKPELAPGADRDREAEWKAHVGAAHAAFKAEAAKRAAKSTEAAKAIEAKGKSSATLSAKAEG